MHLFKTYKITIILTIFIIIFFSSCSSVRSVNSDYTKKSSTKNINNSEAVQRATMRPYVVMGVRYHPAVPRMNEKYTGVASWYGPDFHAKKTSNGEIYNMYAMTAAHKTFPMNTIVKVENLENGKSTVVRINDRGPFVKDRIIDLSNKAAHDIDMVKKGTAKVRLTVLGFNGRIGDTNAPNPDFSVGYVPPSKPAVDYVEPNNKVNKVAQNGKVSLQVGAFSLEDGAIFTKNEYKKRFSNRNIDYVESDGIYRVYIKGFNSRVEAENFKNQNGLNSAVIRE
ncbi:septal ring lytic transglycosylase RlpA family protein [Aliarcobacter skirrowii]|uniref:septal ring lytic transglycosylase RlpA family protein n=1 Tax=Aliarcobacter skirrowii TaxID=28200 RepID=UPI0029B54B9B|nr:septal ring lytic transglycosylase RlpA family protein [Aliarcobacter skirrowii]MDX4049848.1 septal ring lytic transglycosylase RlpA family protein [Aliarcobacter skirrowii]